MDAHKKQILLALAFGLFMGFTTCLWLVKRPPPMAPAALPAVAPNAIVPLPEPLPIARAHHYDVHDGMDYGYTAVLSDLQRNSGQAGGNVVMFSYAGQRGGKHQVHTRKGNVLQAAECSEPCEVVKIMTVVDEEGLSEQVSVEHLRNVPNMIAGLALDDAIKGRLQPYAEYHGQRRYELWLDSGKGLIRTRIKDADPAQAKLAKQ